MAKQKKQKGKSGVRETRSQRKRRKVRGRLNELMRVSFSPYACQQCGACCMAFAIIVTPADISREPRLKAYVMGADEVPEKVGKFLQVVPGKRDVLRGTIKRGKAKCPFVRKVHGKDVYTCSIYNTRPKMCRDYKTCAFHCAVAKLEKKGRNMRLWIKQMLQQRVSRQIITYSVMSEFEKQATKKIKE